MADQPAPPSYGTIRLTFPDGAHRALKLEKPEYTIGRAPGNDVQLASPKISRYHARIKIENRALWVLDLNSANGTFLNGQKISPERWVRVPAGAVLRMGGVKFSKQSRFAIPRAAWGIGAVIVVGLILLCLAVGVVANRLAGRRQTAAICDQPSMGLIAKGGDTYPAVVSPGSVSPTGIPAATSAPGLPSPTILPGDTSPESTLPADASPVPGESPLPTDLIPTVVEATAPPARPITSLAFMELPFPYDGGNENFGGTLAQFKQASQRSSMGGRINSFFDHYFPLYPASNDPSIPGGQEPAEKPIGGFILLYNGMLSELDNYSGHPALDYSTFVRRQPTTPVFAAADGVITAVGEHSSEALFVRIKHSVPGAGDFQTTYWHLHPDEYFEAMRGREGEMVTAGTRIGTMGNTGWSTGHHLHFEVRFDRNNDGFFSGGEAVDPYGFIPSVDYPSDPWFDRAGLASQYLWIHALGVTAEIPESGGGQVDTGGIGGIGQEEDGGTAAAQTSLCAPEGSLPPGGQVIISWAPDPPPETDRTGVGTACTLSVLDQNGQPVSSFDPPVQVTLSFPPGGPAGVDPGTLQIYWMPPGTTSWMPLETTLDLENGLASAFTDRPGQCALLGDPLGDVTPPHTTIEASGDTSPDGAFYDMVTVSLSAEDSESGVDHIDYSLDGGTTWQTYTGPFVLTPGQIPPPPPAMDEEFFGGPPGTYLVLASAADGAGNVEEPPAYLQIGIDPSKGPDDPQLEIDTVTPSLTPTVSPTPTFTLTPTETTLACASTLVVTQGAFCRSGPSTIYDPITAFEANTVLAVEGQNAGSIKWWWVVIPGTQAHCWISDVAVELEGPGACLAVIPDPPTPTPSPTVTPTPTNTPTSTPTNTRPPTSTNTPTSTVTTTPQIIE